MTLIKRLATSTVAATILISSIAASTSTVKAAEPFAGLTVAQISAHIGFDDKNLPHYALVVSIPTDLSSCEDYCRISVVKDDDNQGFLTAVISDGDTELGMMDLHSEDGSPKDVNAQYRHLAHIAGTVMTNMGADGVKIRMHIVGTSLTEPQAYKGALHAASNVRGSLEQFLKPGVTISGGPSFTWERGYDDKTEIFFGLQPF